MRLKPTRESFMPKGCIAIRSKASPAVAYIHTTESGRMVALGFYGKAQKPEFHYTFKTELRRTEYVTDWLKSCDERAAHTLKRQAEKREDLAKPHKLAVGDVLRSSWGYDQTNIDYYEVTALRGKRGVTVRQIGCESIETEYMQGKSVPAKGAYIGEPMNKTVSRQGDSVRIYSFASAYKMEPITVAGKPVGFKPSHWTAYA